MFHILIICIPIFASLIAGYALGRWKSLPSEPFVQAVMELFMPCLVFASLLEQPLSLSFVLSSGLSSAMVVLGVFFLCFFASKLFKIPLRKFALPALFMNTGFMGIPLMKVVYGPLAVGFIVFYDQIQSLFIFTLGISIASQSGKKKFNVKDSFWKIFSEPIVLSILAAFILRLFSILPPSYVMGSVRFLGDVAPALALFALGLRLASVKFEFFLPLLLSVLLRFFGGFFCGLLVVFLGGLSGIPAATVLIASSLPSAVFCYIIAERFDAYPEQAAASVFLTTLLSFLILPFLILLTQFLTGVAPLP